MPCIPRQVHQRRRYLPLLAGVLLAVGVVAGFAWHYAYAPRNLVIAFGRDDGLYCIRPDGTGERKLVDQSRGWPHDAFAVSPDGARAVLVERGSEELDNPLIAFNLRHPETAGEWLYDSPLATLTVHMPYWLPWRRNAVPSAEIFARDLTFTADGSRLVVAGYDSTTAATEGFDLWVLQTKTGDLRRISSLGDACYPSFAPDGQTIVFARNAGLFRIRADGTGVRQLTSVKADKGAEAHSHPSFSPDGRYIAFHRTWKTGKQEWGAEGTELVDVQEATVCVMRADGTGIRRLTTGWNPCWTRMGR